MGPSCALASPPTAAGGGVADRDGRVRPGRGAGRLGPTPLYRKLFDDPAALEHFLAHVVTAEWNERLDAGRQLAEATAELSERHPEFTPQIRAWQERWIETIAGPIADTALILHELAERGAHLVALTNWSAETFPLVRHDPAYDFFARFERIYVSGELRLIKPDAAIFAHVEDDLGRQGDALYFIDDNPRNIAAAAARGWQTHRFTDPASLRADLVRRGLLG